MKVSMHTDDQTTLNILRLGKDDVWRKIYSVDLSMLREQQENQERILQVEVDMPTQTLVI